MPFAVVVRDEAPGQDPEAARSGRRVGPKESVVPDSNQQSAPADSPAITTPASQAVRRARSTPWTRQSASMFAVLPPSRR